MDVVRHDERYARPARDLADALVDADLLLDPVRHQLEVVVALTEDLAVLLRDGARRIEALVLHGARELALQAGGQRDEPRRALAKELLVHTRPVVVAVEVRGGHQRDQVLIADEVLREEHEVEGLAVSFDPRIAVEAALSRDVGLDANDWLDAGVAAERVEVDRAVEGAVIGQGERGHAERFRPCDQIGKTRQPVKQAVFAMRVEVDELLGDDPAPRDRSGSAAVASVYRPERAAVTRLTQRPLRVTLTTTAWWSEALGAFTVCGFEPMTPIPQM